MRGRCENEGDLPCELEFRLQDETLGARLRAKVRRCASPCYRSAIRTEQERDYLQGLGADEIIDARELSGAGSRSDGPRIHEDVFNRISRSWIEAAAAFDYRPIVSSLPQGHNTPRPINWPRRSLAEGRTAPVGIPPSPVLL
jgi:hypothetical protein